MWEGVGDRTELQLIDLHSYGHQSFFTVLLGCSAGDLGAQPLCVLVFSTTSFHSLLWSPKNLSREPEGSLCWVLAFSTASYLQLVWSPNSTGVPRAPSAGCCFLYSIIFQLSDLQTYLIYIIVQRTLHRLWNGMFDRHRAEITVIHFTAHQFVTVPWDLNPVPYCQPSSPTPMECTTSAVFGMACLAGSEVNIQQSESSKKICIFFIKKNWVLWRRNLWLQLA